MYERLRNDFLLELANLKVDNTIKILQVFDKVSAKYDIKLKGKSRKSLGLTTDDNFKYGLYSFLLFI